MTGIYRENTMETEILKNIISIAFAVNGVLVLTAACIRLVIWTLRGE